MAKKQSLKLQVSFKENISDIELYNFILEKGKIMGISSYIKTLVAKDMESDNKK